MSGLYHETSPVDQTPDNGSVQAPDKQLLRSNEDTENSSQARKRKKWKQNLSVLFTDEENLSSDSDAQTKGSGIFETNEAIALRFPYPLVSDDSDNDDDLNYYPRLSENNKYVNKYKKRVLSLSSDENIELSKENESYKHKRRKSNQQKNCTVSQVKYPQETQSLKCKNSVLISNKQQGSKQVASKKNVSHNLVDQKCTSPKYHNSCFSEPKNVLLTTSIPKNSFKTKKNYRFKDIKEAKTTKVKPQRNLYINPRSSEDTTDDNSSQVSKNILNFKRTSLRSIRNKVQKNKANSRFLDSSSEDDVIKRPLRERNQFRRIHLMSTSPSSSDNEEELIKVKKKVKHMLSSSSSNSDDEESIKDVKKKESQSLSGSLTIGDNKLKKNRETERLNIMSTSSSIRGKEESIVNINNEHPTQKVVQKYQAELGLRETNNIHSMSSSSESIVDTEHHALSTKNNSKHKVPIKESLPLNSNKPKSNESKASQNNKEKEDIQSIIQSSKVNKTKKQSPKKIKTIQSESKLNANAWKNIANVPIKRPKSSSTNQSYLQTLKKQFIASNTPCVEIHKKIIDKTVDRRDSIKSKKEMSSKSKILEENLTTEEQNTSLPSSSVNLSGEILTSDNSQNKPLDSNININVQIICSSNLVEDLNRISNSPTDNENKPRPAKLNVNFSLTQQENKETEVSSFENMKSSFTSEGYCAGSSNYNNSNKLKSRTQHQQKLKTNQAKDSGLKEDVLTNEKKSVLSDSGENICTDINKSRNDLLSNILFEMDNNPFNVKKVLPKKVLEPSPEILSLGVKSSSIPNLHSTPSQFIFPLNLQSPEKEIELLNHNGQAENKLAHSKQAIVAISLAEKSPSISQSSSSTKRLHNLNKNLQESKQHEKKLVMEPNSSVENNQKTVDAVITSFYSVNSDDYILPHEDKSPNKNHSSNTSVGTSQLQILNKSSKPSPDKEIILDRSNYEDSRVTEVDQSSYSASNANSNHYNHGQQSVYKNFLETRERLYLENKTIAERNLKDKGYVQGVIDEFTKRISKTNPSITEKSTETKSNSCFQSSNYTNLGNTMLNTPKESTIPLEDDTIKHNEASKKEAIQSNVISDKMPSKGIRIRLGGKVYRLPGKENVIDSEFKIKKQKENILDSVVESENKKASEISSNQQVDKISRLPCTDNTEGKSGKSSSSSEDSSDDSSSSEDRLGDSGKSSGSSSSESSSSEDEKEKPADQNVKVLSKISSKGEINNGNNKVVTNENITYSQILDINKPSKDKTKSFSLDELLGFNGNKKTNNSFLLGSSFDTVRDNTLPLFSSGEPKPKGDVNISNSKSSCLDKKDNILDQNTEKNCTKPSDDVSINQKPAENKIWKIRVRSFEELGIPNVFPLPENALQSSRPVAVEPKEQSLQTELLAQSGVDELNPTSSKHMASTVRKKSRVPPSSLKRKRLLQSNRAVNEQINEFSSIKSVHLPIINVISKDKTIFSSGKRNSIVSNKKCLSNQPNVSKQNIYSTLSTVSNVTDQDVTLKPTQKRTNKQNFSKGKTLVNQSLRPSKTITSIDPTVSALGVISRGNTGLGVGGLPTVNHSTTGNSTIAPSCSGNILDKQQDINQPHSESSAKNTFVPVVKPDKPTDPSALERNRESKFFELCNKLFCEVVMMKLPKIADDLHLVIVHDIMREERLEKLEKLKCPESKEEEKKRTEKEFMEMLRIRGQGFVPLFMTIVRKIEKESLKALVIALYCRIVHRLELMDPVNCTYRFKLRLLIKKMLTRNNIDQEICNIFCDSFESFSSNFHFIEDLLLKYDQFVKSRDETLNQGASDVSNDDATGQTKVQTDNSDVSDISEKTFNQFEITKTVIPSSAKSSISEQTVKSTHETDGNNLQTQPPGRSNENPPLPFGNLDQLLLGTTSE